MPLLSFFFFFYFSLFFRVPLVLNTSERMKFGGFCRTMKFLQRSRQLRWRSRRRERLMAGLRSVMCFARIWHEYLEYIYQIDSIFRCRRVGRSVKLKEVVSRPRRRRSCCRCYFVACRAKGATGVQPDLREV